MKKSVNLYYNKNKSEKDKLLEIKEFGFDEFFTDIYDTNEDLTLREQCQFAKSIGLQCTMIHCLYNEPILHYFWEDGESGDNICEDYCKQIRSCKGLTKNFVIHLNANKDQKQSKFGLLRLRKILNVCDECDINLCIENLYSEKEIPYIFRYIKHKRLKICFDVGHQNFLTPNFDIMKRYGKYVEVLHLHDNHGLKDEHLVCGQGNIDWSIVAKGLRSFPNLVLSAEVKCKDCVKDNFLSDVYNGLCIIENLTHRL